MNQIMIQSLQRQMDKEVNCQNTNSNLEENQDAE
jgi:hypothetical protein